MPAGFPRRTLLGNSMNKILKDLSLQAHLQGFVEPVEGALVEERAGVHFAVLSGTLVVGEPYQRLWTGEGFVKFFGKACDRVALRPGYQGRAPYLVDTVGQAVLGGDPKPVHDRD